MLHVCFLQSKKARRLRQARLYKVKCQFTAGRPLPNAGPILQRYPLAAAKRAPAGGGAVLQSKVPAHSGQARTPDVFCTKQKSPPVAAGAALQSKVPIHSGPLPNAGTILQRYPLAAAKRAPAGGGAVLQSRVPAHSRRARTPDVFFTKQEPDYCGTQSIPFSGAGRFCAANSDAEARKAPMASLAAAMGAWMQDAPEFLGNSAVPLPGPGFICKL